MAAEKEKCPICGVEFREGDICATEIELGCVHAECLDGAPVVDLDTGNETDAPLDAYSYKP